MVRLCTERARWTDARSSRPVRAAEEAMESVAGSLSGVPASLGRCEGGVRAGGARGREGRGVREIVRDAAARARAAPPGSGVEYRFMFILRHCFMFILRHSESPVHVRRLSSDFCMQ